MRTVGTFIVKILKDLTDPVCKEQNMENMVWMVPPLDTREEGVHEVDEILWLKGLSPTLNLTDGKMVYDVFIES